jgi:hypothetical protein
MLRLLQFPVWKFLNQPLFEPYCDPVLNPARFWHIHQIDYLERCLCVEDAPNHPSQSKDV